MDEKKLREELFRIDNLRDRLSVMLVDLQEYIKEDEALKRDGMVLISSIIKRRDTLLRERRLVATKLNQLTLPF